MLNGYTLLWGLASEENILKAQSYPFHMVNFDYVLAYGKPDDNGLEKANDNVVAALSDNDRTWLKACIDAICINENEENARQNDAAFMEAFERELEVEFQKEQKAAKEG